MRNIMPGTTLSQVTILSLSVSIGSPSVIGGNCNFKGSARTKSFWPVFVHSKRGYEILTVEGELALKGANQRPFDGNARTCCFFKKELKMALNSSGLTYNRLM